jgi:hypothetical protein
MKTMLTWTTYQKLNNCLKCKYCSYKLSSLYIHIWPAHINKLVCSTNIIWGACLVRAATDNRREIENKKMQTMNTVIWLHGLVKCPYVCNYRAAVVPYYYLNEIGFSVLQTNHIYIKLHLTQLPLPALCVYEPYSTCLVFDSCQCRTLIHITLINMTSTHAILFNYYVVTLNNLYLM